MTQVAMLAPPPSTGKLAIRTAGNSATFYSQDQPTATGVDGRQRLTYPALFRRLQLLQLRIDIQLRVLAHQL